MLQKLKSLVAHDTIFNSILILLVAVASFGLGRQSVAEDSKNTAIKDRSMVQIIDPTPAVSVDSAIVPSSVAPKEESAVVEDTANTVIASKSGTKFHLPTCPGAKQIKEANRITFPNTAAAIAAGYEPAANCPGLQ